VNEQRENLSKGLLQNRIAVVTGAANGIGQGIALAMAEEGAFVVIADTDIEGSRTTKLAIEQFEGQSLTVSTDIRDEMSCHHLVETTLTHFGRIDILVNNAGIGIHEQSGILDMPHAKGMQVFQTNLIGPLFLTQRVAQEMVRRQTQGILLFTTSIHANVTYLDPAYTATKAALEMVVRDVAVELAEYGIRVNAIAPGAIETHGGQDRSYSFVPLGYKGTPRDVANAMVFLASEKASYITGQTLIVDGGLSLAHEAYLDKKQLLKRS